MDFFAVKPTYAAEVEEEVAWGQASQNGWALLGGHNGRNV